MSFFEKKAFSLSMSRLFSGIELSFSSLMGRIDGKGFRLVSGCRLMNKRLPCFRNGSRVRIT